MRALFYLIFLLPLSAQAYSWQPESLNIKEGDQVLELHIKRDGDLSAENLAVISSGTALKSLVDSDSGEYALSSEYVVFFENSELSEPLFLYLRKTPDKRGKRDIFLSLESEPSVVLRIEIEGEEKKPVDGANPLTNSVQGSAQNENPLLKKNFTLPLGQKINPDGQEKEDGSKELNFKTEKPDGGVENRDGLNEKTPESAIEQSADQKEPLEQGKKLSPPGTKPEMPKGPQLQTPPDLHSHAPFAQPERPPFRESQRVDRPFPHPPSENSFFKNRPFQKKENSPQRPAAENSKPAPAQKNLVLKQNPISLKEIEWALFGFVLFALVLIRRFLKV